MTSKQEALDYHREGASREDRGRPDQAVLTAARPVARLHARRRRAVPARSHERPGRRVLEYTARGNLVAVISNGTAVLGLGNIGALAGKPVMEGKGVLFKRFADIDVFDIEVDTRTRRRSSEIVPALEPTFGGINLEDIKAPECFEIEERLLKRASRSRSSTTTSTAPRSSPARRCSTRSSSRARSIDDVQGRRSRRGRRGASPAREFFVQPRRAAREHPDVRHARA